MSIIVNRPQKDSGNQAPAGHREIVSFSGSALIDYLINHKEPAQYVQSLNPADFYWVVKQIGDDECLPVLELASEEQWMHLFDLEVWRRDELDAGKSFAWMKRLSEADPHRLAEWIFGEAEELFCLLMLRMAEVVVRDEDDEGQPLVHHFSLDGRIFIRTLNPQDKEPLEKIMRILADADYQNYHGLLYRLATIMPVEVEENIYRFRNARLGDAGFIPTEEAVSVYSPLRPQDVGRAAAPVQPPARDAGELVPVSAFGRVDESGFFGRALSLIDDAAARDRIAFEFSDLGNRIIAAEGFPEIGDAESLQQYSRRAWSYVNIALERLSGGDVESARENLQSQALLSLFRVGYGFALNLQRAARTWRDQSWFLRQGKQNDFWGSPWSDVLNGILSVRPLYSAANGIDRRFRDFSTQDELKETGWELAQIQALDALLERLAQEGTLIDDIAAAATFHPLLFNPWLRKVLDMAPSTAPVSLAELKSFFRKVRGKTAKQPYAMPGYEEIFVADFLTGAHDFDDAMKAGLQKALHAVWRDFRHEYEKVSIADLVKRHVRFFLVEQP